MYLSHLALKTFNQMANGHARRDSVRIDDNIGHNAFGCEWHVLKVEEQNIDDHSSKYKAHNHTSTR
jgi:hypothetical protein